MITLNFKNMTRRTNNTPVINIDPNKIAKSDFDLMLMSKFDVFYRRIVEYTLHIIEGGKEETLVILVDDDGVEYAMDLPFEGFKKSLTKAIEYFEKIEEYETCDLIKQIILSL